MGLDMYLRRGKSYDTAEVGYWRKANHIHKWFVDNVQNGEDDCEWYPVTKEQLLTLYNLCKIIIDGSVLVDGKIKNGQRLTKKGWEDIIEDGKILQDETLASQLLPTQDGFFFGGTEYDEYYIKDLKRTMDIIEALKNDPQDTFYYHSSW